MPSCQKKWGSCDLLCAVPVLGGRFLSLKQSKPFASVWHKNVYKSGYVSDVFKCSIRLPLLESPTPRHFLICACMRPKASQSHFDFLPRKILDKTMGGSGWCGSGWCLEAFASSWHRTCSRWPHETTI